MTNWFNEAGELAQSEGEVKWFYGGVKDEFKPEVVAQVMDDTFTQDEEVYLCISSNNSSLVSKQTAVEEIGKYIHKKEIGVLDKSFTKMMNFTQLGVFQVGVIREFPESRIKPAGQPLNVAFHANIVDETTMKVSDIICDRFDSLESELHKDYGGAMEHLWIDVELVEGDKTWPFRFQKRVNNPTSFTEFYTYNVGHYSVKPDFQKLRNLSTEQSICSYIFGLLYDSTQILVDKQNKLDGFDAALFRSDFLKACEKLGYYALK